MNTDEGRWKYPRPHRRAHCTRDPWLPRLHLFYSCPFVSIRGSSLFFFLVLHQLQSMSHEGTQFKKPGSVFISVYPRALRFSKKPGTAIDANRATAIQQLFKVFANPLQKKGTTEHTKHTDKR